jgi:hypothetical protein
MAHLSITMISSVYHDGPARLLRWYHRSINMAPSVYYGVISIFHHHGSIYILRWSHLSINLTPSVYYDDLMCLSPWPRLSFTVISSVHHHGPVRLLRWSHLPLNICLTIQRMSWLTGHVPLILPKLVGSLVLPIFCTEPCKFSPPPHQRAPGGPAFDLFAELQVLKYHQLCEFLPQKRTSGACQNLHLLYLLHAT